MALAAPLTLADKLRDRERWLRFADCLAVGLAASLPWSTSATGIFAALLAIVVLPTTRVDEWRAVLRIPAGWLPVLLCVLGALGMLWANVPMAERWDGLRSFTKLLFIPLLIVQFQRSDRGQWVLIGFLISCVMLLVASWFFALTPGLIWRGNTTAGVPVKDYLAQGAEFTVCVFVLADLALMRWRQERRRDAIALSLLALMFLLNVLTVSFNRTAIVVLPILIVLFGLLRFGWRGTVALIAGALLMVAIAWPLSEPLRRRVMTFTTEVSAYRTDSVRSSAGERLEFYKKSLGFIASAPVAGHGTGSIRDLFRQSAVGQTGMSALASTNPHNQTLAVAIQLGLIGVTVLFAMWIAHLLLFRGVGLAAWVGLVVAGQNIVGSLFNSHLFDFTHGWIYVVGVGIAAGTVLYERVAGKGGISA
ncbi:MAG: O-antigen ligase family protein [Pseudomonadota bacterium]